jgi:RecB family exonuclease
MLSRFSHSSLDTFRTCPRQFKFQKIEKVEVPRRTSADTYLGAAIHRQLQSIHEQAAIGRQYTLDDAIRAYEADWEKPDREFIVVIQEHLTVDDYIENGRKMLRSYYQRYAPFDQGTLLGAEMNINFDLPGTSFRFQAKIDRLWKRPDGVVEICDYKTGRFPPQGIQSPDFRRQMGLYQIAVQTNFPNFETIELAQYFLKFDEVLHRRLSPEELDEITEQFKIDVLATDHAERLDDFPTQESPLCNYCSYFHLCPAKRHRLILTSEAGAESGEKATMQSAAELADKYLDLDTRVKELEAERDALKVDLINLAKELGVDKFSGREADLSVKIKTEEKLITRTADPDKAGNLAFLVRQWGFEDYFALNESAFMKDVYGKGRLSDDQLAKLREFIITRESARVARVKRKGGDDD